MWIWNKVTYILTTLCPKKTGHAYYGQEFFGFQLPSVQIAKRITKFEIQFQERSRLIKL